ncbi:MAG TPA: hypothetical protein VM100_12930 [Longimicrobiales bacterium]|nr:hypothetical protein [Longimicrobiales bacterium]
MRKLLYISVVASAAMFGCREAPALFEPKLSPADSSQGVRLTYSLGRDRAPFWNATSDTVYYTAEGVYAPLPTTHGVFIGIPAEGGRSSVFMPERQLNVSPVRFLGGGAVAPDGKSVAYFDLVEYKGVDLDCVYFCTVRDTAFTQPSITGGVLRISPLNATGDKDTVTVPFGGRYWDPTHQHYGLSGAWVLDAYPFQRLIIGTGAQPFRASWSPDGKRLVYSDGLQLHIYDTSTRKSQLIPGTYDGVYAAWSPKGDWIAYSRFLRSDSTVSECLCANRRTGAVAEEQRRVIFNQPTLGSGALMLVKPDGSQQRVLGPGDMPSWVPDGEGLVFRRSSSLWRASIDGTQAQPIPLTNDAEEPAVSPDGKRIAFVRVGLGLNGADASSALNPDIWVVPFRVTAK